MRNSGRFVIENDLAEPLLLSIEPEGARFPLSSKEKVSVIDEFALHPVTVTFSKSTAGELFVSIWPGDGSVRVEKDGVDVLEML